MSCKRCGTYGHYSPTCNVTHHKQSGQLLDPSTSLKARTAAKRSSSGDAAALPASLQRVQSGDSRVAADGGAAGSASPPATSGSAHLASGEFTTYVLKLQDSHYYVGYSRDAASRIDAHARGVGSLWTSLHRPAETLSTRSFATELEALMAEERTTLDLMKQHGICRVRGARWCLAELSADGFASAAHYSGACMQCGEQGHFIKACPSGVVLRAADGCRDGALTALRAALVAAQCEVERLRLEVQDAELRARLASTGLAKPFGGDADL